jgi:hypothetical protein
MKVAGPTLRIVIDGREYRFERDYPVVHGW